MLELRSDNHVLRSRIPDFEAHKDAEQRPAPEGDDIGIIDLDGQKPLEVQMAGDDIIVTTEQKALVCSLKTNLPRITQAITSLAIVRAVAVLPGRRLAIISDVRQRLF